MCNNLPLCFDVTKKCQKKGGTLFQILWPSHNILTLQTHLYCRILDISAITPAISQKIYEKMRWLRFQ